MKCDDVRPVLSAYVDAELSADEMNAVATHLTGCSGCRTEERQLRLVLDELKAKPLRATAPRHLRKALSASLAEEDARTSSGLGFPALGYSLASLFLGIALGWGGLMWMQQQEQQGALVQSLTSAHIRSLMADHLVDVASSDSHTVKPWFHGRLDFSPPVHDLTGKGFPLIGGRLDYLAGQPVPAFVYRHKQHEINLFVLPQSASETPDDIMERDGYQLIHWRDDGFDWWAVSDLNKTDLVQFRESFQHPQ